jgi:hypothetical protein
MLKDIIEARATGGHRLYLQFEDGVSGEVNLERLVDFKGVFAPLLDPEELAKVKADPEIGTVCWPNGADLDPDVLYAELTGKSTALRESFRIFS